MAEYRTTRKVLPDGRYVWVGDRAHVKGGSAGFEVAGFLGDLVKLFVGWAECPACAGVGRGCTECGGTGRFPQHQYFHYSMIDIPKLRGVLCSG